MSLKVTEIFSFGGVDSRSNPINMPANRCLRLRNFLLAYDGSLRLRDGYTDFANSGSASAIHSIIGFKVLGGDRYLIFAQGSAIKVLDLTTSVFATATVRGTAVSGTGRWSWYLANNRLHGTNGTVTKFLMFSGGTWTLRDVGVRALTAAEVASTTVAQGNINANAVPKSTVADAQPGYQLYAALWNRTTGAVGNRIKIGARLLYTDDTREIGITNLPDLAGDDSELDLVIGRTGDGAEVPYPITDASENWVYVAHGTTTATIVTPGIDGAAELPTRNTLPPAALSATARVGDYVYGIVSNGPWIYRTLSGVDNVDDLSSDSPASPGRPEQSWPVSTETFPTGDVPIGIHGFNGDAWIQTLEDLAILVDQQGVPGWQGPWTGAGIAGQEAFAVGWKGVPYWLSGHKQLWTMVAEGPIPISDEYETALLSQIGDTYLSQTQVIPFRDSERQLEILIIKARDASGNPFLVIHDFNARDERSPYGQAMDAIYGDQLASEFYLANARDVDSHAQLFAGAANGHIYKLFDGVSDNGAEFTADLIGLPYVGPYRTAVEIVEWYGDENVEWYISSALDKTENDLAQFTRLDDDPAEKVPGDEENPHYRVQIPAPEFIHAYLWIRLSSHSADAPAQGMRLNSPPHMPIEVYGRIFVVSPLVGTSRGK